MNAGNRKLILRFPDSAIAIPRIFMEIRTPFPKEVCACENSGDSEGGSEGPMGSKSFAGRYISWDTADIRDYDI